MNKETKILILLGTLTTILIVGGAILFGNNQQTPVQNTNGSVNPSLLIRKNSDTLGNPSSKVKLVEFGDYQCPACRAAYPVVKQLINDNHGKIFFVFRNFPLLAIHQNTMIAAEAAEAAGEQGKYWQMHDKLYDEQNQWGESANPLDYFLKYAKDLNLDVPKFEQAIKSGKFKDKIMQDEGDGNALGVNATPTFFLNGQKFTGFATDLQTQVNQILKTK